MLLKWQSVTDLTVFLIKISSVSLLNCILCKKAHQMFLKIFIKSPIHFYNFAFFVSFFSNSYCVEFSYQTSVIDRVTFTKKYRKVMK